LEGALIVYWLKKLSQLLGLSQQTNQEKVLEVAIMNCPPRILGACPPPSPNCL
jgi:hypothetical protein